jgi:hypothetical protein
MDVVVALMVVMAVDVMLLDGEALLLGGVVLQEGEDSGMEKEGERERNVSVEVDINGCGSELTVVLFVRDQWYYFRFFGMYLSLMLYLLWTLLLSLLLLLFAFRCSCLFLLLFVTMEIKGEGVRWTLSCFSSFFVFVFGLVLPLLFVLRFCVLFACEIGRSRGSIGTLRLELNQLSYWK